MPLDLVLFQGKLARRARSELATLRLTVRSQIHPFSPHCCGKIPRFYQSGTGTFWHRTGYAISRIFVTRTDSGHEQFHYSEFLGSALAAGISTYSYHPRADRTLPNIASVRWTQVGYDTLTIVVKEFFVSST